MARTFLGVGVSFPLKADNNGVIEIAAYEASVRQSIWLILGTAKGERVMRPEFGSGIYDLVFETQTAATAGQISQMVREDLLFWEPRIEVLDVEVVPQSTSEGEELRASCPAVNFRRGRIIDRYRLSSPGNQ